VGEVKRPLVSVLLPVYNGETWLKESIESILAQTYCHFELIVISDGSTDGSPQVVEQFRDARIRFFQQPNRGLAATLNRAIRLAKGTYLARQDQDDISLPQRFEKQVAFLESHPRCGLVGTWTAVCSENRQAKGILRPSPDKLNLQFDLLLNNVLVHSSVMMRKAVLGKVGLYSTDDARQPPEDYELWSRVARACEVANVAEVLHIYRVVASSMSRKGYGPLVDRAIMLCAENLAWANGCQRGQVHLDIGALVHGATHRVGPRPRFQEMRRVLFQAAARLCARADVPRHTLANRAQLCWKQLQWQYRLSRFPGFVRRMYGLGVLLLSDLAAWRMAKSNGSVVRRGQAAF
jgi:glycosyltransferase involved in cell wall biosynthesis